MALNRDGPSKNDRWTLCALDRPSESSVDLLSFSDQLGIISMSRQCRKCEKDSMKYNQRTDGLSGQQQQNNGKEVGMPTRSTPYWNKLCRQVVHWSMNKRATPIGGCDDVVEIDESKFGKRKYDRGHHVEGSWVFGGISRSTGAAFVVQVEKKDRPTLLPLIKKWILPGTTIIRNDWRAYDTLEEEDYELLRVIHKRTFKTKASEVTDRFPDHFRKKKRFAK